MRKIWIYILLLTVISPLFASCEQWFDVSPKVEIKEDDLFKDENGFFDALVGVYSIMAKQELYGDQMTMGFMDALVQNYSLTNTANSLYYVAQFDYKNTRIRPTVDNFWNRMYEAVVNVNNLLVRLEKADKSIFSEDNYGLIKGEALALRAYLHFDVLRMFGPSFKMDKSRRCMPYVKTVSKKNTPYSTPEQVVEQCVNDLQEALGYLSTDPVQNKVQDDGNIYRMNRKTRLNLYAVRGQLARVYMYGENPVKALEYARTLVDNDTLPLTTNMQGVKNDRIFSGELLFGLFVDNLASWTDNYFRKGDYELFQLDYYLTEFYEVNAGLGKDIRYVEQFNIESYNGKLNKYLNASSDAYTARYRIPMLRLSEIYYIAAEATTNPEEAARWLNMVRTARGLAEKAFNGFPEIQTYLTAEYRREFYGEGQLFYRYKWLNSKTIAEGYLVKNIADRMEAVYLFPLPDQEREFGDVAGQN